MSTYHCLLSGWGENAYWGDVPEPCLACESVLCSGGPENMLYWAVGTKLVGRFSANGSRFLKNHYAIIITINLSEKFHKELNIKVYMIYDNWHCVLFISQCIAPRPGLVTRMFFTDIHWVNWSLGKNVDLNIWTWAFPEFAYGNWSPPQLLINPCGEHVQSEKRKCRGHHLWNIIRNKRHAGREAGKGNQENTKMVLNFHSQLKRFIVLCQFALWELLDHIIYYLT